MIRYLLAGLVGLALGLAAGLLYAWEISPVEYTDISPAALLPEQRDEFIILAAQAYAADGDLARAEDRLAPLADPDLARTVTALAQRASAEGRSPDAVSALSALALALGVGPGPAPTAGPATAPPFAQSPEAAATQSLPTPTTSVTRIVPTPSATPIFEYDLADVEKVCDASLGGPLIQAQVQTADGQPIPGVEVLVTWEGGGDHFFTGFKPELGLGYGDFSMTPDTAYTVALAARSRPAEDLIAETCEGDNGQSYLGSWLVTFRRLP
jgi:hypothetical protein